MGERTFPTAWLAVFIGVIQWTVTAIFASMAEVALVVAPLTMAAALLAEGGALARHYTQLDEDEMWRAGRPSRSFAVMALAFAIGTFYGAQELESAGTTTWAIAGQPVVPFAVAGFCLAAYLSSHRTVRVLEAARA